MKIKIKYTKFQIVLEIIAILILLGAYAYVFLRWGNLPERIPGHYNAAGVVDRWGNKSELILVLIETTVLYLIVTATSFFPSIWNMPVKVTDNNRDAVYGMARNLLLVMKVEAMLLFFYLNYHSVGAKPLSPFFLPIVLICLFGTLIYYIIKIRRRAKGNDEVTPGRGAY